MPRVEHESWCEDHCEDEFVGGNGSGVCHTLPAEFGPLDEAPPQWNMNPMPRGTVSANRIGEQAIDVYVDYRTHTGGTMDTGALRAVREAVAESPTEFLAALDQIIETLGAEVPVALVRARDAS